MGCHRTTPATARTRCSRFASARSVSPRPASTRSIGRSSSSSPWARPSVGSVGQRPRSPSTATERHTPTSRLRAGARSHGTEGSGDDRHAQRHGSPASVRRRPPDRRLPLREQVRLSIYWLGLSSIFAGLTTLLAGRIEFDALADPEDAGRTLLLLTVGGAAIAAIVQPTIGTISDYTISRWGAGSRTSSSARCSMSCSWPASPSARTCSPSRPSSRCSSSRRTSPRDRSGCTSGPRPGAAGRDGQRARRADADPRQCVRVHHRRHRGRARPVRPRPAGAGHAG